MNRSNRYSIDFTLICLQVIEMLLNATHAKLDDVLSLAKYWNKAKTTSLSCHTVDCPTVAPHMPWISPWWWSPQWPHMGPKRACLLDILKTFQKLGSLWAANENVSITCSCSSISLYTGIISHSCMQLVQPAMLIPGLFSCNIFTLQPRFKIKAILDKTMIARWQAT